MLVAGFYIFLYPLVFVMENLLQAFFYVSSSYGWSIVFLSFTISTILLPIYNRASLWQKEDRLKRQKMEVKNQEIKGVYKGQEHRAYLAALRRMHHYTPLYPLRASCGFFLY